MIEYLYGTWLLCLIALLVYVLHKMFYKTKSASSRPTTGSATVTPNDGLRSQQFYIYTIDGRTTTNPNTNVHLDLPPKYEDVVKDNSSPPPNYRREVS